MIARRLIWVNHSNDELFSVVLMKFLLKKGPARLRLYL